MNIIADLDRKGFSLVGPVTSWEFARDAIEEIILHLESQPRLKDEKIRIPRGPMTPEQIEELKQRWVPWMGEGVVNEPPAYHLHHAWQMRQNPYIVSLFAAVLGADPVDLRVSIDRYKATLPGCGERVFCHWDNNPLTPVGKRQVQGLLSLSKVKFHVFPGTHTEAFRQKLKARKPDVKISDLVAHDEFEITVPPGCLLIWDRRLLYSVYPNRTERIEYGFFLTYQHASEAGQSDEDRLQSYINGRNPQKQPSGRRLTYLPPKWYRFRRHISDYQKRLPEEMWTSEVNESGRTKVVLLEPKPVDYIPPRLTELGWHLLCGGR